MAYVIAYSIIYVTVFGYLGFWVAVECGRGRLEGFVLGALFGPLGVIVVGLLPKFPDKKAIRDARYIHTRTDPLPDDVDDPAIQEWLHNRD